MVDAKGLNVTAELVKTMKTKRAQIIGNIEYVYFTDDKGRQKEKLKMDVELETGQTYQYIPNITSYKTLCKLFGTKDIDVNWKGKLFQWIVSTAMWQGKKTEVLYIDEVDLNKIEEVKV